MKPTHETPASWIRLPTPVPTALLPSQCPARAPRDMAEHSPSARAPATHVGAKNEAPGSWLLRGPTLAGAATWDVNKYEEGCFCSLSLYLKKKR